MPRTAVKSLAAILALGLGVTAPLAAQEYTCAQGGVIVQGGGDRSDAICEAAAEATEQLASCNLTVSRPITIEITRTIPANCHGLYHCEEDLIQLLPLEGYGKSLSGDPGGSFGHLEPEVFFKSVLRHELAHAALDTALCPYEGCPVTREFVAYTMQIWFLSDADRAPFDQRVVEAERPMTRDDVNALALMMVPEAFIENAYAYLSQQDDPCALIGAIASGEVVFDLPFR